MVLPMLEFSLERMVKEQFRGKNILTCSQDIKKNLWDSGRNCEEQRRSS